MSLTGIAFLVAFGAGLLLALFRHPIYGLWTYLGAFYLHPPSRWWGEALPDYRWSLIAALVTLVATIRLPSSTTRPPWYDFWGARILIVYVVWMWIQTLWAVDSDLHLEGCILFTKYVVLLYLIYKTVTDKHMFELFSWGHILGCFYFGLTAFNLTVSGRLDSVGGPGINDANLLAMHQITGVAFAGFLFLGISGKRRWIALAAIPFILNSIIQTESRGAFLGLIGAGVAALYFGPRKSRKMIAGAMVLGAILFLWLTHAQFWDRMSTLTITTEAEMETSQRSRIALIRYGFVMAGDFPLGTGYRGHAALSAQYLPPWLLSGIPPRRSAHDTFMSVLVEQGIPGAFLFVALLISVCGSLLSLKWRGGKITADGLGIYSASLGTAFMAVFVCGLFMSALNAEVQIWLLALMSVLKNLYDESEGAGGEAGQSPLPWSSPGQAVEGIRASG
jgi:hypothetical protein